MVRYWWAMWFGFFRLLPLCSRLGCHWYRSLLRRAAVPLHNARSLLPLCRLGQLNGLTAACLSESHQTLCFFLPAVVTDLLFFPQFLCFYRRRFYWDLPGDFYHHL